MLHYAIFRETCVETAKSALLRLHEQRCYTLQCFLQLVLHETRCIFIGWSYKTLRDKSQEVPHCAMLQKSVAALPKLLRKVEIDSTSCNSCCNKNVAKLDDCGVCYTLSLLCIDIVMSITDLMIAGYVARQVHEKLHSVTPSYSLRKNPEFQASTSPLCWSVKADFFDFLIEFSGQYNKDDLNNGSKFKSKYKKVGVLPIRIEKFNVASA